MEKALNLIISGLVTGALYSMMASGLVLTYQTTGIFNFAHGAIAFVTALVFYELHTGIGWGIVPSALVAIIAFAPGLGLLLDRVVLRRLATSPVYVRIIGTIGLLVAIPAAALWLLENVLIDFAGFDLDKVSETASTGIAAPGLGPQPPGVLRISDGLALNTDQLAVFGAALISAGMLWFVLQHTKLGLRMRATVDRPALAATRGVDPARMSMAAWVLSFLLAGLGGVLIAPLFQLGEPVFTFVVLGSLAAVAVARLTSIWIAFAAGLILGVIQNLVAGYGDTFLPASLNKLTGFRSSVPFILTLVALIWLGRNRGRLAGTVSDEVPPPDLGYDLPVWRRTLPWALLVVAIIVYVNGWIPFPALSADNFERGLVAQGLAYALIFLSFVVITGLGGMVCLAQATFVTAGGFAAGWALSRDWGIDLPLIATNGRLNFLWAVVIASFVAAGIGALVALPVAKLGPLALALATLALALVAGLVIFEYQPIGKGSFGWTVRPPSLSLPGLSAIDFSETRNQVYLLLAVFGLGTLGTRNLRRSSTGRAALAIRSSEVAARTSGLAPLRYRIVLFAISAGMAGCGGALLGLTLGAVSKGTAPALAGLTWIAITVTFGVRRPGGALLAGLAAGGGMAALFEWLGNDVLPTSMGSAVASPYFITMLFGLGAVTLANNPDGALGMNAASLAARRRKRLESEKEEPAVSRTTTGVRTRGLSEGAIEDGSVLRAERIIAGYGDVEVLHGVTIGVPAGRVVLVLGANGAGKSTLAMTLAGVVPCTSGTIEMNSRDITADAAHVRARAGLMVVPEARGVFPGLSVEDNLKLRCADEQTLSRVYDRFPVLGDRRKRAAGLLSGGEQQMLSLATALEDPPEVLIADEPTLGLAPMAGDQVLAALVELRDKGCAIVLIEERAERALEVADHVAVMQAGHMVWAGPRNELSRDVLAAAYLGIEHEVAGDEVR